MNIEEKLKIIYANAVSKTDYLLNDYKVENNFQLLIFYQNNIRLAIINPSSYIPINQIKLIEDIFYYTIIKFWTYEEVKKLIDITETNYVLERLKL
jgi:hypothetical protein